MGRKKPWKGSTANGLATCSMSPCHFSTAFIFQLQHAFGSLPIPTEWTVEYNRLFQLEGTYNAHLVQLSDHFRLDQKLKHILKDNLLMPLTDRLGEPTSSLSKKPVPVSDQPSGWRNASRCLGWASPGTALNHSHKSCHWISKEILIKLSHSLLTCTSYHLVFHPSNLFDTKKTGEEQKGVAACEKVTSTYGYDGWFWNGVLVVVMKEVFSFPKLIYTQCNHGNGMKHSMMAAKDSWKSMYLIIKINSNR